MSTPIGNLEDLSLRAANVLTSIDYLACEDSRQTGQLIKRLPALFPALKTKGLSPRYLSYFEGNENSRIPQIISLLQTGQDVALVSNAGTPLVSDPGFKLVRTCVEKKISVVSIPGPCAAITALTCSGQPTDQFLFLGFLPKKAGKRERLLQSLKGISSTITPTVIIYLSPHRFYKELIAIEKTFGNMVITLCRELTKLHEETIQIMITEVLQKYQSNPPKGELILLFSLKDLPLQKLTTSN
ncbi:16S rRNA (cytidine(1402)-2'-O)-methyltransferase [Patescibacteria group bacterium]